MLFSFFETIISSVTLLLSYISGNSSFPKPLSAKDEQFYIERYKNGDMAARDVLIEHNLRLVAHIAKKYSNSNEDNEDIISIGTIGLIKASPALTPQKAHVSPHTPHDVLIILYKHSGSVLQQWGILCAVRQKYKNLLQYSK